MPIKKLTTVEGFVVLDLDDAPVSTGIVRSAPSILQSGAADLARSLTYAYASLGLAWTPQVEEVVHEHARAGNAVQVHDPSNHRRDSRSAVGSWKIVT